MEISSSIILIALVISITVIVTFSIRFMLGFFSRPADPLPADVSGECSICLSGFEEGPDQHYFLPCCHAFHEECIAVWLRTSHTCPLCQCSIHAADLDIVPVPSAPPFVGPDDGH